jgi:hypothetical protein
MADNSFDATGTELFLSLDGTTVLKFDCPTAINGIGFTTNEVNNGCLDDVADTSRPGKKKLNAVTVPYNVQAGSEAHEYLANLQNNVTEEIPYCIALSDGTADPTITAGAFVAPGGSGTETRSSYIGTCFVSANSAEIQNGNIVTGSFTFMPQSQTFIPKA